MILGEKLAYQCTKCEQILFNDTLMSGNNFGSTLWSDGYQEAPMLPEFPNLTICPSCQTFLWLNKMTPLGQDNSDEELSNHEVHHGTERTYDETENLNFSQGTDAEFLTLTQYFSALDQKICNTKEDEIFIRLRIHWGYNHRARKNKPMFTSETEEVQWQENAAALVKLLGTDTINHLLLKIDIERSLGNFDAAQKLLKLPVDDGIRPIHNKMSWAVRQEKKDVFRFN